MKRGSKPQNYNVLALSVIANNENTANGAVYADESGNIINNTIVNNYTSTSTDDSDKNASYTGGLYVKGYCYAVNNIIWNNGIKRASEENATTNTAGQQAQIHAVNATTDKVRFYNNALSSPNSAVWNNVYQSGTMTLGTDETEWEHSSMAHGTISRNVSDYSTSGHQSTTTGPPRTERRYTRQDCLYICSTRNCSIIPMSTSWAMFTLPLLSEPITLL